MLEEMTTDRGWSLIIPLVFFIAGIVSCFSTPIFLYNWGIVITATVCVMICYFLIKRLPKKITLFLICYCFGVIVTCVRLEMQQVGKQQSKYSKNAIVKGTVSKIRLSKRSLITLKDLYVDGDKIISGMFRFRDKKNIIIGDNITMISSTWNRRYNRYYSSMTPMAYYSDGIVTMGFAKEILEEKPGKWYSLTRIAHKIKLFASNRIDISIAPEDGKGVVKAMLLGDSSDISTLTIENIRLSGLAHLLAISGLHLTIIAGGIFICIRKILVRYAVVRHNINIKKFAATCSILCAAIYLIIAGNPISAVRSFICFSLLMTGILLDRSIIVLRIWSIAAFTILLFTPEKVFGPSFQMSFVATFTLISGFNAIKRKSHISEIDGNFTTIENWQEGINLSSNLLKSNVKLTKNKNHKKQIQLQQSEENAKINIQTNKKAVSQLYDSFNVTIETLNNKISSSKTLSKAVSIVLSSSIIAIPLGIIEVYHFGYFSVAGIFSNIIAILIVELIALPCSFAGLLLLGTGLDLVLFSIAGYAAYLVTLIAKLFYSLPISRIPLPDITESSLACFMVSTILILRFKKASALIGISFAFLGIIIHSSQAKPNFIIDYKNKIFVYRSSDNTYRTLGTKKNKFITNVISKHIGSEITPREGVDNIECLMSNNISKCLYKYSGQTIAIQTDIPINGETYFSEADNTEENTEYEHKHKTPLLTFQLMKYKKIANFSLLNQGQSIEEFIENNTNGIYIGHLDKDGANITYYPNMTNKLSTQIQSGMIKMRIEDIQTTEEEVKG